VASESFYIYRKQLPHWRQESAAYFLTWRSHKTQPELTPAERTLVSDAIQYFHRVRYALLAYVVMNDHVHVLVQPLPPNELQQIVQSWKSYTAHELQKKFQRGVPVWQDEYFDRIVRDESEFQQKANYILGNPRKRWPELEDYPWAWFAQD